MNGRRGGGEGRHGSGGCEGWGRGWSVSACVFWFSLYFSDLLQSVVTLFVFGKAAPDDLPHAPQRQALRWSTRAQSAGDQPDLTGSRSGSSGAPRRHALHMLQRHTSVSSHARAHDVCTNSPHPRPRQEREARLAPSVSSSAKRTTPSTSLPPRGNSRKLSGEQQV